MSLAQAQVKDRLERAPDKIAGQDDQIRPESAGQSNRVPDDFKRSERIAEYAF
jgi:hypothetical protein